MAPNWTRIFAFLLGIVGLFLLLRFREPIGAFLSAMGSVGPYHPRDQQVIGMIALGFAAICLLALIKALLKDKENRP